MALPGGRHLWRQGLGGASYDSWKGVPLPVSQYPFKLRR